MLCKYLQDEGIKAHYTKEPYCNDLIPLIGKYSDGDLINSPVLMYLLAADRFIHVKDIISWIQMGMFVICDRYVLSSLVYQRIQGIPLNIIRRTNSFAINPDLTFYIDVPLEERLIRLRRAHKGIRTFFLRDDNLIKEQKLYRKLINNWDEKRYGKIVVINGQQNITKIHRIIVNLMLKNLDSRPRF
jgi:dTMP kinase